MIREQSLYLAAATRGQRDRPHAEILFLDLGAGQILFSISRGLMYEASCLLGLHVGWSAQGNGGDVDTEKINLNGALMSSGLWFLRYRYVLWYSPENSPGIEQM